MRWGIIAALVFGCGFCAADEINLEAVRGTLDKAVDTYFEEIIELDKEITERIDKLIEMASNRGDLNAVDELERQREAYLRTGFMPEGRIHLVTRRKAEFGINRAKSRLDQAYEEAIEVLTKEGRFTDARRIRSERLNLEQKLSAAQPELQPTNTISQARERLHPTNKQRNEGMPVTQQAANTSTTKIIPDILKDLDRELIPIQDRFVREITFLTDGIAHALSNAAGRVYFEKLKEINGSHLKIILSKPNGPFSLNFECPTEIRSDFVLAVEQLLLAEPKRQIVLAIRESSLDPKDFEKLLRLSEYGSKESSLQLDLPYPRLTSAHISAYKKVLSDQPKYRQLRTLSLREKDYLMGHGAILQMGPYNNVEIVGHDNETNGSNDTKIRNT